MSLPSTTSGAADEAPPRSALWEAVSRPGADQFFRLALLDSLAEGVMLVGADLTVVWASPAAERILGLAPLAPGPRSIDQLYLRCVDEDGAELTPAQTPSARTLASGQPLDAQIMGLHLVGGGFRWLSISTRPVPDEDGRPAGCVATFTDITEERTARRRFERLAAFAPIGIGLVNGHGIITLANPLFTALNGFDPTGFPIDGLLPRIHPDDVAAVAEAMRMVLASPEQRDMEFRLRMHGAYRWLRCRTMPATDGTSADGYVVTAEDIHDHRSAQDELAFRATHDSLTGLANRAVVEERLAAILAGSGPQRPALLLIDLDGFKEINDSLGHDVGDRLLAHVSAQVLGACPPDCTVARLGGDEFAVLVPDARITGEPQLLAARILGAVRVPLIVNGIDIAGGCSIGIALATDQTRPEELLQQADIAMYAAKGQGRNRVITFDADMGAQVNRRLVLRRGLANAVARDELQLAFQPLVRLGDGSVNGFEALLRWNSAEIGAVRPDEFIPVAEESGQMTAIGLWVIERGLMALELLNPRRGGELPVHLSVNVSPRQLTDTGFFLDLVTALKAREVDPESVVLEITETALIDEPLAVSALLARVSDLGVRIAIDDFGSGNASLSYLRRLPIDIVKVDRTLVQAIDTDPAETRALLRSVVDIAAALDLVTVAEGVETEHHLAEVTALGFDLGQGYLFARPMPLDQAICFKHTNQTASWGI